MTTIISELANYPTLAEEILFVNVGISEDDYFNWKNPATDKIFTHLDAIALRTYARDSEYFIRLKDARREAKTVVKRFANANPAQEVVFIVIASLSCQYQVIEAFVEELAAKWFIIFDFPQKAVVSSTEIFNVFCDVIEGAFHNVPADLKKIQVSCKPLNRFVDVYVKKSLVTGAASLPVALVFECEPYHMLIYLDGQFKVREQKIVDYSG